jgi:hypothetical protein
MEALESGSCWHAARLTSARDEQVCYEVPIREPRLVSERKESSVEAGMTVQSLGRVGIAHKDLLTDSPRPSTEDPFAIFSMHVDLDHW